MGQRYEAIFGFNTKQWWAYDTQTGEFCDPPTEVLKEIKQNSAKTNQDEEEYFNKILASQPDWLNDAGHRYNGETEI